PVPLAALGGRADRAPVRAVPVHAAVALGRAETPGAGRGIFPVLPVLGGESGGWNPLNPYPFPPPPPPARVFCAFAGPFPAPGGLKFTGMGWQITSPRRRKAGSQSNMRNWFLGTALLLVLTVPVATGQKGNPKGGKPPQPEPANPADYDALVRAKQAV